jgi:hypothetical protein
MLRWLRSYYEVQHVISKDADADPAIDPRYFEDDYGELYRCWQSGF